MRPARAELSYTSIAECGQIDIGKQCLSGPKENRRERKLHFVNEPGPKILADRRDAAAPDVSSICSALATLLGREDFGFTVADQSRDHGASIVRRCFQSWP